MPNLRKKISSLANEIKPSAIRQLTVEFEKRKAASTENSERCISFGLGEPFVLIPKTAIAGAQTFLEKASKGPQRYPSNNGLLELRESISSYLKKFGLSFAPSEILVTNGGREAIMLALFSTLNEGDKLIVPSPCWVAYPELAKIRIKRSDIHFLPTTLNNNFVPTPEDLERLITKLEKGLGSENKIILQLTDPHNPTGIAFPQEVKKEIADLAVDHDLMVFSDEIYAGLIPKYKSIVSYPGMEDRSIVFSGTAKVFSMTAWALGLLACKDKDIYNLMNALKGHASVTPSVTQQAASMVFNDPNSNAFAEGNRQLFLKRAALVNGWADKNGLEHSKTALGMIYSWISIAKSGLTADDFCKKALEHGVLIIPGSGFGDPMIDPELNKYIRISLSANEVDLEEGLARLQKIIS